MANIKSSKKDVIRSEKARQRNVACRSAVKTARRKVVDAIAAGKLEEAKELFRAAESAMAKASKKGVFKKETASRRVSRLANMLAKASKA
jgi:small subunit ribosomal protein S20